MAIFDHGVGGNAPPLGLEQLLRMAIVSLEAKLAGDERIQPGSLAQVDGIGPQEVGRASILAAANATAARLDTEALLLHALERPQLAQTPPQSGRPDGQSCTATCLLRENLAQYLAAQLDHYWQSRKAGAAPPVTDFASPPSPPDGYLSMEQLEAKADGLFDDWIAALLEEQDEPPDECDALGELKELADQVVPDEEGTAALLWLALEYRAVHAIGPETGDIGQALLLELLRLAGVDMDRAARAGSFESRPLADSRPENYACLLDQHMAGELALTPASLIWENLYLHFVEHLECRWEAWIGSHWIEQPDGCAFCRAERGEWRWDPFAGLPFLFAPVGDRVDTGAGEDTLPVGPHCRAVFDTGGVLSFWHRDRHYQVSEASGVAPLDEAP